MVLIDMSGFLKETVKLACRRNQYLRVLQTRLYADQASSSSSSSSSPPSSTQSTPAIKDVPGLSKNMVDCPSTEVGPGASKTSTYKNPEYYCYHNKSYFEAEVEMMKYRLPQPSNKVPLTK